MKNNIFVLNEDFFDNDIDVEVSDEMTPEDKPIGNVFGIYTESDLSPKVFTGNASVLDFKIQLLRFVRTMEERIRIFEMNKKPVVKFIFSPKPIPTMGSYIEHNMEIPEQKYTYVVDFKDKGNNINTNIYMNVMAGLKMLAGWEKYPEDATHGCTLGILFKFPGEFKKNCSITEFMNDMIVVYGYITGIQTYLRSMCCPRARRSDANDNYFYYKDNGEVISSVSNKYSLNGGRFYKDFYKKLYDSQKEEYTDDEKKYLRKLTNKTRLDNIYYIWHKIYFNKRTRDEFEYTPMGYQTGSNEEYKFYAMLKPKDPDAWTFENINDWFKETFVNACSETDKINACHGYTCTFITFFISVPKDNLPKRSDKKKTYIFNYKEQCGHNTINWKLSYVDGNFVQVNHNSRAFISDNALNSGCAYSEYKDDLVDGVFGKKAILLLPELLRKNTKYETKDDATV